MSNSPHRLLSFVVLGLVVLSTQPAVAQDPDGDPTYRTIRLHEGCKPDTNARGEYNEKRSVSVEAERFDSGGVRPFLELACASALSGKKIAEAEPLGSGAGRTFTEARRSIYSSDQLNT